MARFRLIAKHYLNVTIPGRKIFWRYTEESRDGIANEQEFPVPLYLDPEDQRWQNYPGEIIVATEPDKAFPRDYILKGEPTIEMEALDEAAEALRAELMPKWTNPVESLPAQGLSANEQTFMEAMMKQMGALIQPQAPDLTLINKRLEELEAQNAALKAQLEGKPAVARRA